MRLYPKSFRTRLIIILEVLVLAISASAGFVSLRKMDRSVRETSEKRLTAIASSTAAVIDPEKHEEIFESRDRDSKSYQEIHKTMRDVMLANDKVDDIYTMKRLTDGNWVYVIEAYEEEDLDGNGSISEDEMEFDIGEEFDPSEFSGLEEAFNGPSVDRQVGCDKWGCFLSGYAPIRDASGEVVAILGVDIYAQDIIHFEKDSLRNVSLLIAVIAIIFPALLFFLLKKQTEPIKKIVRGIGKFGKDMDYRLKIETGDEFEMIARTFNRMAGEMQDFYGKLEEEVRRKTKELSESVKEIKREKAKDEALLSSIGDAVIAADSKGNIILANNQARELLQTQDEEVVGKKLAGILIIEDEKGEQRLLEENEGSRIDFDRYLITRKGKKIPIMTTFSRVILEGKNVGSIFVLRDISKEKEIDIAKSEFVSLASHQLKNPLSSIKWHLEILLEEDQKILSESQRQHFNKIYASSQEMIRLINSLLNVSRIEMGSFSINPKKLNPISIISSILEELGAQISRKNLKISEDYDETDLEFSADPELLRIILENLLSNAVKYTGENGHIWVNIKRGEEEEIMIEVRDDGYGIPKGQNEKIFTKLFRADNVRSLDTEGTGLGLYITKSIIDNSNGKINLESEEGKGTMVRITFPKEGMSAKKGTRNLIQS